MGSKRCDHPQNDQVEKSAEDRERANAAMIKNNIFNFSEIPVPFPPTPFKKNEWTQFWLLSVKGRGVQAINYKVLITADPYQNRIEEIAAQMKSL